MTNAPREPMRDILKEARNLTPSIYLTLLSIIQSFAFGFLFAAILEHWRVLSDPFSSGGLIGWLQVLAVFQLIVLTLHVNVQHTTMFSRVCGIRDSYIPFLYAVPQYLLVKFICNEAMLCLWFYFLSWFTFLSLIAYWNMYRVTRNPNEPVNDAAFRALGKYPLRIQARLIAGIVTSSLLSLWLLGFARKEQVWMPVAALLFANGVILYFTWFHRRFCWQRVISILENPSPMRLTTQLSKGPPYKFEFKLDLLPSERAVIQRAEAWDHCLLRSVNEGIPSISVRCLVEGSSFQADSLLSVQLMDSHVDSASQSLRKLLDTLDGFGEPKVRDY